MAVTFDAASNIGAGTAVTTLSLTTLTVGTGSNRALVALLSFSQGSIPTGLTVTWDSGGTNQAMTQITGATASQGTVPTTVLFGLVNPVSGNKTLKASWTPTAACQLAAMSFI